MGGRQARLVAQQQCGAARHWHQGHAGWGRFAIGGVCGGVLDGEVEDHAGDGRGAGRAEQDVDRKATLIESVAVLVGAAAGGCGAAAA